MTVMESSGTVCLQLDWGTKIMLMVESGSPAWLAVVAVPT